MIKSKFHNNLIQVENSLTVDNVKHTQLHIVKAHPVPQVDCIVSFLNFVGNFLNRFVSS